jgi:hypothetical protein
MRNYPPDESPEQAPPGDQPPAQRAMAAQGMRLLLHKSDDPPHKHAALTSGNGAISRDNVRNGRAEGLVNKWPYSNRLHRQCPLAYDHSRGHLESRSQLTFRGIPGAATGPARLGGIGSPVAFSDLRGKQPDLGALFFWR